MDGQIIEIQQMQESINKRLRERGTMRVNYARVINLNGWPNVKFMPLCN